MSKRSEAFNLGSLKEKDFFSIAKYVEEQVGMVIPLQKKSLVESRLQKRLNETGLSFEKYLSLVRENVEERVYFIDQITTHKTDWFREPVHFRFLEQLVAARKTEGIRQPLQIWSAACSTGEEPATIAMVLGEAGLRPTLDFRILASDVSEVCLAKARSGSFKVATVHSQVAPQYCQKYFSKDMGANREPMLKFSSDLMKAMKFRPFNLISSDWPVPIQFDVIFLRNVLIYFPAPTVQLVVKRLLRYLKPNGHLIVGLSETIPRYDLLGLGRAEGSVYKK